MGTGSSTVKARDNVITTPTERIGAMFNDDEEYQFCFALSVVFAVIVIACVAINVGTDYSCRTKAIAAGMTSIDVKGACK
jgi:hypothetical protein